VKGSGGSSAAAAAEKKASAPVSQIAKPAAAALKKPAVQSPAAKPAASVKKPSPVAKPVAAVSKPAAQAIAVAAKVPGGGADRSGELDDLNSKLSKLRLTIEGLEKERNFYFGKLRQIEILAQQDETKDTETKQAVLKILYHTDDEDFASPNAESPGEAGTDTAIDAATEDKPAEESGDNLLDSVGSDGDLLAPPPAEDTF